MRQRNSRKLRNRRVLGGYSWRHLAEAAKAAQRDAEGSTTDAVLVDNDAATAMTASPVLSPHETHGWRLWKRVVVW